MNQNIPKGSKMLSTTTTTETTACLKMLKNVPEYSRRLQKILESSSRFYTILEVFIMF